MEGKNKKKLSQKGPANERKKANSRWVKTEKAGLRTKKK